MAIAVPNSIPSSGMVYQTMAVHRRCNHYLIQVAMAANERLSIENTHRILRIVLDFREGLLLNWKPRSPLVIIGERIT